MHLFIQLESFLISLAEKLPLEIFVVVGSFVEEVIAPIPSPTVMIVSGSAAQIQGYALYMLIILALLGALGKVLGALLVYFISDKAENIVMHKCEKFFNVTHADVEKLGSKLGNGTRDYVLLTFLRALPFIPSVVLSVGAGLLKIPLPLFIMSTFLGTVIRDGVYLYAGYIGTEAIASFVKGSEYLEKYILTFFIVAFLCIFSWFIYQRRAKILN